MKMVNIMQFKIYIYVISVMLSAYTLTGVNFDSIIKKNKRIEARLLVILLSFIMGYLITNFIVDFTSSI
ncbi:MAG: DUF1146 domain-containing protein [Firmicutes bacterium]|nr:DUF1146 domain-containing protein [Bacillota bacterium]